MPRSSTSRTRPAGGSRVSGRNGVAPLRVPAWMAVTAREACLAQSAPGAVAARAARVALSVALVLGVTVPAGAIVGGDDALPGAWPAVAALVRTDADEPRSGQFCGATVVHPEWVLTAGHCVVASAPVAADSEGEAVEPGTLEVVLGRVALSGTGGEVVGIVDVVVSPDYAGAGATGDLALLRLAGPTAVEPLPLADPNGPGAWAPGVEATILGWGATQPDGSAPADHLRQAQVPIREPADCAQAYPDAFDPAGQLCAGQASGDPDAPSADTCVGDSGGPLVAPLVDGTPGVVAVTSFGSRACGVDRPGLYALVGPHRQWIVDVTGLGSGPPGGPDGPPEPTRIAGDPGGVTDPAAQAAAVSAQVFGPQEAVRAVLARADAFPDALGGSALAGGDGPLLFARSGGLLPDPTREELLRTLPPGAPVYLLGGVAALPESLAEEIAALGFEPRRLGGAVREETAALVASEVLALRAAEPDAPLSPTRSIAGDGAACPPAGPQPACGRLSDVILAGSANWPDAVTAGQLAAAWGWPVLLTPADALAPEAGQWLDAHRPLRVVVVGGSAAVGDQAAAGAGEAAGAAVERLAGADRFGTAAAIGREQRRLAEEAGDGIRTAVVVNLRRDDAFTHVLSAAPLLARRLGLLLPVEGADGSMAPMATLQLACAILAPVVVLGGEDVIAPATAAEVGEAVASAGCAERAVRPVGRPG